MAFTFAAFCYIVALILTAFLIFFAVWQVSLIFLKEVAGVTLRSVLRKNKRAKSDCSFTLYHFLNYR